MLEKKYNVDNKFGTRNFHLITCSKQEKGKGIVRLKKKMSNKGEYEKKIDLIMKKKPKEKIKNQMNVHKIMQGDMNNLG
ncbi:hypothetical protein PMALA_014520 [Plasmodium malariae]|uniref:Uncharacterized protein n=1 Tax=Plasmodium malariae TaxID=5858 RepID=A0A1A8W2U3_PLAMA|nr:hypothetical protein PMALA_014520 [Plasmodium malariae]